MTIKERLVYFTSCLLYKCLNDLAPTYLTNQFQYIRQYHNYPIRSANLSNLVMPRPNTSLLHIHFLILERKPGTHYLYMLERPLHFPLLNLL